MDFEELHHQLRHGAAVELDEALRDGALGEIEISRDNKISLRK